MSLLITSDRPAGLVTDGVDLEEVLRVNRQTYGQLAVPYEATGAQRLVQAQRWLRPALRRMRSTERQLSVLELGSADGYLTGHISELGHSVTAVEFAPAMAESTRAHAPSANVIEEDFLDVEFDSQFDVILCSAFVHLFPAPWDRVVLNKVNGLLTSGGIAYVATTIHPTSQAGMEFKTGELPRYRTRYTVRDFAALIQSSGLVASKFYKTRDRLAAEKTWANWITRRGES